MHRATPKTNTMRGGGGRGRGGGRKSNYGGFKLATVSDTPLFRRAGTRAMGGGGGGREGGGGGREGGGGRGRERERMGRGVSRTQREIFADVLDREVVHTKRTHTHMHQAHTR